MQPSAASESSCANGSPAFVDKSSLQLSRFPRAYVRKVGTCKYVFSQEVGRAPAVVEPRYRSRHVGGVCCRDKSGMPESRALLLRALLSCRGPSQPVYFIKPLPPTPPPHGYPLFYYHCNHSVRLVLMIECTTGEGIPKHLGFSRRCARARGSRERGGTLREKQMKGRRGILMSHSNYLFFPTPFLVQNIFREERER